MTVLRRRKGRVRSGALVITLAALAIAPPRPAHASTEPKCRGLKITEFLAYLQTEAGIEFDISPKIAEEEGMSMEQLIGRAQGLWEGATQFEYARALRDENPTVEEGAGGGGGTDGGEDDDDVGPVTYPYIVCSNDDDEDGVAQWDAAVGSVPAQRKPSGFERRQVIKDAIVSATTATGSTFDGGSAAMKDVFNARGTFCVIASLPGSVAQAIEFDTCVVQPMFLATKLGAGTVSLAVAIVNAYANGTKYELDDADDVSALIEEHAAPREVDSNGDGDTTAEDKAFPGLTVSLCPGFLSSDDVFSSVMKKQEKVDKIMTRWLLSKTAEGGESTSHIRSNTFWTGGNADNTTTRRGKFWNEVLDRVSETDVCANTFKKRLSWTIEPGIGENAFTNLHVTYNNSGASSTDNDCVLAMIAGISINPDICFFELNLEKRPQSNGLHRPNADWMVQSYVYQARPFFDAGLDGTGVVAAVSDTGLDVNNCYFWDKSNEVGKSHRKIISYNVFNGDDSDYQGGHGSHVCGLLAGKKASDGVTVDDDGQGDGIAPGAKIAFVDTTVGKDGYNYPSDTELLNAGREGVDDADKARIHSASWGVRGQNIYTAQAATFDDYMFQNDDYLMVMAAGNGGRYGQMDSIFAPSTSKNSVTVGAIHSAEDDLTDDMAGPEYVADFSGKGTTGDGRISPDIIAPGKFLLSAGAQPDQEGECDPIDGSIPEVGYNTQIDGLKYDAGTSMATPVVSGTAALVIQYFQDGFYPAGERRPGASISPSNALVKAVLMNGAQTDGIKGVDNLSFGIAEVRPYDANLGFGRINLLTSLYIKGKSFVQAEIWDRQTIKDGEKKTYSVTVDESNGCSYEKFSTTLVWFEGSSPTHCSKCLLNDLDLHVTKNGNEDLKYYPNGRSFKDSVNTVERVVFSTGVADGDVYTIHISADNLSTATQDFALVATGCFGGVASEYAGMSYDDFGASSDGEGGANIATTIALSVVGALLLLQYQWLAP